MNSLSNSDYRLIEAKIDGSMSDQEQELFEQKLKDSQDFDREFQMQNAVIQSLIQSERKVLKKEFKSYLQESKRQQQQNSPKRRNLMIAASLSFLVLCSIMYYLFLQGSTSHDTMYQAYFEVYPAPPVTRGNEVGAGPVDYDNYRKGKYAQAIENFRSGPQSEMTLIYLSMCYLQTGQVTEAINSLQAALTSESSLVQQTAEWYLALAYLKNNDRDSSLELLQKIISGNQLYDKQARKILKDISE